MEAMATHLEKIDHQAKFFKNPAMAEFAPKLAAIYAKSVSALCEAKLLAPGILSCIGGDLIYCALRHRIWTMSPLFRAALSEHLKEDFAIPEEMAQSVTSGFFAGAKSLLGSNEVTDLDFISYVCVTALTTSDQERLLTDLGFGRGLLTRVHQALSSPAENIQSQLVYISEIDARIRQAVKELANEILSCPWALNKKRLYFLLIDSERTWSDQFISHGVEWVFELLQRMCQDGTLKTSEILRHAKNDLPPYPANAPERAAEELCELLMDKGLVARDGNRTWSALPLASELTAPAIAANWQSNSFNLIREISRLSPYVQADILKSHPFDMNFFTEVILHVRPISPLGIKTASRRIAECEGASAALPILYRALSHESSFYLSTALREMVDELKTVVEQRDQAVANSCDGQ